MFDKSEIKVNMNGDEYIRYKESRKLKPLKLSKGLKKALPYFILCFAGVIILGILLSDLIPKPETSSVFDNYYEATANTDWSWNSIAKISAVFFAPLIIIAVCIGWVVHGVGFFIIRR